MHDTHTSVAISTAKQYVRESGDKKPIIVASTASPYKFASDVLASLCPEENTSDPLLALEALSALTKTEITAPLRDIDKREVRFKEIISPETMINTIREYVK